MFLTLLGPIIRYCNAQNHEVHRLGFIIDDLSIINCRLLHFVFYFKRTEDFIKNSSLCINRSPLIGFGYPPVTLSSLMQGCWSIESTSTLTFPNCDQQPENQNGFLDEEGDRNSLCQYESNEWFRIAPLVSVVHWERSIKWELLTPFSAEATVYPVFGWSYISHQCSNVTCNFCPFLFHPHRHETFQIVTYFAFFFKFDVIIAFWAILKIEFLIESLR